MPKKYGEAESNKRGSHDDLADIQGDQLRKRTLSSSALEVTIDQIFVKKKSINH